MGDKLIEKADEEEDWESDRSCIVEFLYCGQDEYGEDVIQISDDENEVVIQISDDENEDMIQILDEKN